MCKVNFYHTSLLVAEKFVSVFKLQSDTRNFINIQRGKLQHIPKLYSEFVVTEKKVEYGKLLSRFDQEMQESTSSINFAEIIAIFK